MSEVERIRQEALEGAQMDYQHAVDRVRRTAIAIRDLCGKLITSEPPWRTIGDSDPIRDRGLTLAQEIDDARAAFERMVKAAEANKTR